METANEGRFSSRIGSERVDGVDYELNSLKNQSLFLSIYPRPPTLLIIY